MKEETLKALGASLSKKTIGLTTIPIYELKRGPNKECEVYITQASNNPDNPKEYIEKELWALYFIMGDARYKAVISNQVINDANFIEKGIQEGMDKMNQALWKEAQEIAKNN